MVVKTSYYKMFLLRCVTLSLAFSQDVTSNGKTLKLVHVVYRHGARSPISFYPNDMYQEKDWPGGAGSLTQKGMEMVYQLGIFFRKRYIEDKKFISKMYKHEEVYVRSVGIDRCLQSAECQLAGLFPPQGNRIRIPWKAIPVHYVHRNNDPIMRSSFDYCPRRNLIWEERKLLPSYKKKMTESADLFKSLTNLTGMKIDEENVYYVADTTICELTEGLIIPEWIGDLWKRIYDLHIWRMFYKYYGEGNDELARLLGGPLLAQIVNDMKNVRSNKGIPTGPKFNIFSGQDYIILGLASALDLKIDFPVFGSCIMVELYHSEKLGFLVEIFYLNGNVKTPTRMKLKQCGYSCPLDTFIHLVMNRVSRNREGECRV